MAPLDLHAVDLPPAGEPTGRPLVLVHGLASNLRLWDGVARRAAAAGRRVVACDLRGHGRSPKPDDGYDLATVAGDVAALVERLGLGPCTLAGQSYGGNVVLQVAADRPDLVAAVACVDGGLHDLRRRFPEWEECALRLAPPKLAGTPAAQLEAWLRQAHPSWPEEGIQGQLACMEVRDDGTVAPWLTFERHLQVLRGLWSSDSPALWARVTRPALLLAADQPSDPAWTEAKQDDVERCAELLAGPSVLVEWLVGDHDLHAEQPDAVAALLLGL